ncbi:hypothetical protein LPTSP4_06130 [Leptospira ryugenii]|uniref:Uncharacterized protein n=1 Tax=Leptospira ryugenii TaxID=1917863 RepID=A0A2P2DWU7_9LEPT|nr:hypothetical protein [Leptospira ryugenii]GBF49103.1 hypothetical protein LPTSP4_06130 [Leptospira ryugenii]
MKVKVAHLFKKLEEIERDSSELKKLTDRLADDREYSPVLKASFSQEIEKLEEQRKEILSIKVEKNPTLVATNSQVTESAERTNTEPLDRKKSDKPVRKY